MESASPDRQPATPLDWVFRVLGFLVLFIVAFNLPKYPVLELDASWRMAVGRFFAEGRQFGSEVVFTYGPLGWTMAKTYWGAQWSWLFVWFVAQSLLMAVLVFWYARRLQGYYRIFFLLFFFIWGLTYQDAVHMTAIAFLGFEQIRRSNQPWRWSSLLLLALLVVYSLVKFTNVLLAFSLVSLAGLLELWTSRRITALRTPAVFGVLFLLGWKLCGQNIGNLPSYFRSSWEISQGYQDAMGLPCPTSQLVVGVIIAVLMLVYLALAVLTQTDRVRGLVLATGGFAYLYVNWKHGFIRADGHQIGFHYAVLTLVVAAPLLLDETLKLRLVKNLVLGAAALCTLVAMDLVLPGLVRGSLGIAQDQLNRNLAFAFNARATYSSYPQRFDAERDAVNLVKVRDTVREASIDVLGFEQGIALFNRLNYQPRPVFQGYSAYTPYLSHLNLDYYASDRAPEYVLFKLQTLDGRLETMDDPDALRLLVHRYTYLFTEQGFTVWKKKPGLFVAADFAPKPERTVDSKLGEVIPLGDLTTANVWMQVDFNFTLLGKLKRFFLRPPLVQLRITDEKGTETVHRLPRPIAENGFMLNPVVNDQLEFMRAAGGIASRRVRSVTIEAAPDDKNGVKIPIRVVFSKLPASAEGKAFLRHVNEAKFHMFKAAPVSFEALNPPGEDLIDNQKVMILHAPSQMLFEVPANAKTLTGSFGFVAGAYSGQAHTNGANFVIVWNEGSKQTVLFERFLNPAATQSDRGLQKFTVQLPKSTGYVYLRVEPGPFGEYAFDWTGWTGIEFQ